ncbi:MAG: hypothetical protein ACRDQ2_17315 [Gaiellales bacterium]
MRGRTRWPAVLAGVALAVGVAVGGIAAASGDERPRTEVVTGTFQASPANVKTRTCQGQDGAYLQISRGTWRGTITSSDPRLTGRLKFSARALVNTTTGLGTFEGAFRVRQASGRTGARGQFATVVTGGNLNHGFAIAKVPRGPDPGEGAGVFHGNFESTVDPALNVVGRFGGAGQPLDPAVIQSGSCVEDNDDDDD